MIELPENYKQNVINRYGKEGMKWLNSVDKIIEKYKKEFNLSHIKLASNLTMNVLLFASSEKYGDVVVKIGSPSKTSVSEINYINLCPTKHFVQCYYYNINDRIMILEKVSPGYSLKNLENQEERIAIFSNIYNTIITSNVSSKLFPSYEEIFKKRRNLVYNDRKTYSDILYMLDIANGLYAEIQNLHLPICLLHNDLHHKNILKANHDWKVIDPHGVIGEKIFETTMFIREELKMTHLDDIEQIISLVAKNTNEDKLLLYKALYINTFIKIVFHIKAKYSMKEIDFDIKICEKILEYLNKDTNV